MANDNATRTQEQLKHLAHVNALGKAIASAISAIEKNDLAQFEAHLASQESICNRLAATKCGADAAEGSDSPVELEIRQSYVELAHLNRVYMTLLKSAQRSVGLIVALYRNYGEGYDRGPSALSQSHTWSCEV
jgi:hypothetical protein